MVSHLVCCAFLSCFGQFGYACILFAELNNMTAKKRSKRGRGKKRMWQRSKNKMRKWSTRRKVVLH